MRRWLTTITTGLTTAAALSLSACGTPAETAVWVKATFVAPNVGDCYTHRATDQWSRLADLPHPCNDSHYLETAFVGRLPDAKAADTLPPDVSADEYSQCQVEAAKYLGGDIHSARVSIHVTMPSDRDWELGARWFRCDLTTYDDFDTRTDPLWTMERLKDGMVGAEPALLRCINSPDVDSKTITSMPLVQCTDPHNAEYAGYSLAPDGDYPEEAAMDKLGDSCGPIIDEYVGAFRKENFLGYIWYIPTRNEWKLGDRTVSCFVAGFDGHHWSSSLKDLGTKAFPK